MIDLRERRLPSTIESGGRVYDLDTDFRTWIRFGDTLETEGVALFDIFANRRPPLHDRGWLDPAIEFYRSPSATPRATGEARERSLDLVMDGDHIVASFQAAYGIDLTDPELTMHWHRFKALLAGLPDDSKMASIMAYRTWRKSSKKHDAIMAEGKAMWALPERGAERDMEEAKRAAEAMYEAQNGGENG